jgi:hypothetical protein
MNDERQKQSLEIILLQVFEGQTESQSRTKKAQRKKNKADPIRRGKDVKCLPSDFYDAASLPRVTRTDPAVTRSVAVLVQIRWLTPRV